MHSGGIVFAYSADGIAQDCLSFGGFKLDPNGVLVLNSESFGIRRGKVNVSLGNDNALGKLNLAAGAN